MFLKFDTTKTCQAIGVILRQHRASIATKLRILKLLYIADRESIQERGWPVLRSRAVAMDHGPLHSLVLDLINGEHVDEPRFSECFEVDGNAVQMTNDPGVGRLSRADIAKLQEVCRRYDSVSDWDLSKQVTHSFSEWQKHYREGTSTAIPMESIIEAVGRSEDMDSILEDLRQEYNADLAFGRRSL